MATEPNSKNDIEQTPFRPGHEVSTISQLRLRRAFKNAARLFDEQSEWFSVYEPQIQSYSNSQGTEHRLSLCVPDPPEDWALQIGEISNHLSSAKDNLFTEIVRKFSGYSDNRIQKQLGNTYWPVCRSLTEWEKTADKFSFIPEWLLKRIETFQPFRDRPDENTTPDENWMSMGASTWARSVNNSDKHSQPVELALNHFLHEPLQLKGTLAEPTGVEQRFDYSDPSSEEAMISIRSAPSTGVRLKVDSVGFLLMTRKTPKSSWAPLNQSIWHVLVENQVIFNTVYYGQEAALERIIPWAHDDGVLISDAIYSWNRKGKCQLRVRRNITLDALQAGYV